MKAVGVKYAAELNLATGRFGVEQALLQSIIDVANDKDNIMGIPSGAHQFARSYASNRGYADSINENGLYHPEANIMAGAWWLVRMNQIYADQWTAVKAYFDMSPVGEGKMRRIYYTLYPKWLKQWEGLA